jgi:YD repeat-containing protein
LVSVTVGGQTTQFIYDGDGNLVKKVKPDGSKTIYVGGVYEVDKTSGGAVTRTLTYYPIAGVTLAPIKTSFGRFLFFNDHPRGGIFSMDAGFRKSE